MDKVVLDYISKPLLTDWLMVALTLAYVIVSAFILLAVKRQANIADKSAEATKETAVAARLQAESLINAERPWIVVEVKTVENSDYFVFEAANHGRTPAEIISFNLKWNSIAMAIDDVPDVPEYGPLALVHRPLIASGKRWSCPDMEFDLGNLIRNDEELKTNIVSNRRRFLFWGRIAYADVLGEPRGDRPVRETRFCYFYSPLLHNLLPAGKPGYNEHT